MNITPESAYYALDRPPDQVIARRKYIIYEAEHSNEPWAASLVNEACEYLEELNP